MNEYNVDRNYDNQGMENNYDNLPSELSNNNLNTMNQMNDQNNNSLNFNQSNSTEINGLNNDKNIQTINNNSENVSNNSIGPRPKNNKIDWKKIIVIIVVLLAVLFLITRCSNKKKAYNGYIASMGEKLTINEVINHFSIEATTPIQTVTYKEDPNSIDYNNEYIKIGIKFENYNNESLQFVDFYLADENKQEVAKLVPLTKFSDDLTQAGLYSKGIKEGSFYFNNDYDVTKKNHELNPSIINEVKYIKVSVAASADSNNNIEYEYYYLTLK